MTKEEFFREADTTTRGLLDGMLVLEACTTYAGPVAAAELADLGAEVGAAFAQSRLRCRCAGHGWADVDYRPRRRAAAQNGQCDCGPDRDSMWRLWRWAALRTTVLPPKFARTPTRIRIPAPPLGQDNAEVYGSLGCKQEALEEWRQEGVI